ncbi:hypothetical protein J6590_023418 [Homalodisca vitripennis]|nr:hypothetical protein J6590_023418 [Homalodisca vitripennis]
MVFRQIHLEDGDRVTIHDTQDRTVLGVSVSVYLHRVKRRIHLEDGDHVTIHDTRDRTVLGVSVSVYLHRVKRRIHLEDGDRVTIHDTQDRTVLGVSVSVYLHRVKRRIHLEDGDRVTIHDTQDRTVLGVSVSVYLHRVKRQCEIQLSVQYPAPRANGRFQGRCHVRSDDSTGPAIMSGLRHRLGESILPTLHEALEMSQARRCSRWLTPIYSVPLRCHGRRHINNHPTRHNTQAKPYFVGDYTGRAHSLYIQYFNVSLLAYQELSDRTQMEGLSGRRLCIKERKSCSGRGNCSAFHMNKETNKGNESAPDAVTGFLLHPLLLRSAKSFISVELCNVLKHIDRMMIEQEYAECSLYCAPVYKYKNLIWPRKRIFIRSNAFRRAETGWKELLASAAVGLSERVGRAEGVARIALSYKAKLVQPS